MAASWVRSINGGRWWISAALATVFGLMLASPPTSRGFLPTWLAVGGKAALALAHAVFAIVQFIAQRRRGAST